MDLRILHTYPVSYVPHRCHNTRTAHFRATTDVTLRAVAAAETTLAFRVSGKGRFAPVDGRPRAMIAWGDRLWLELEPAEALARRFADPARAVQKTPFDACNHLNFAGGYGSTELSKDTEAVIRRREGAGPMREWRDDGGEAVAARLRRRAEDMIVVDGVVYVRDYEPVWEKDYGDRLEITVAEADPDDPFGGAYRGVLKHEVWRADRVSQCPVAPPEDYSIEVVDKAYVRCNDEGRRIAAAVTQAASTLSHHMAELPVEAADLFYDAREALAATRGGFGPAVVEAAYRLSEIAAFAAPATRAKAEAANAAARPVAEAMGRVLAAWESRADDGREWQHLGLPVTVTAQGGKIVREVLDLETADRAARQLGVDLSAAAAAAAAGGDRLFLVERVPGWHQRVVEAAAAVTDGPAGPVVAGVVGPAGGAAAEEALTALRGHLFAVSPGAGVPLPDIAPPAPRR